MTEVDPVAVLDAAQKINLSGLSIGSRAEKLSQTLAGLTGMAGTDTAAQSFANAYDPAGRDFMGAIDNLAKGTANIGLVLGASAQNHNDANAAAARKPPPDIGAMPGQSGFTVSAPPPAAGDPSPGPWWWDLIAAYVQGKVWPNGHQDQLRQAADAWDGFADGVSTDAEGFYQGVQTLRGQDSEDIDAGLIMSESAYENVFAVAQNARSMAAVCREHAQSIDDAHSAIEEAAAELIVSTVLIWAVGALASTVTAGGGAAVATGLSAANLARIGASVANIIRGFEGAAVATAGGAVRAGTAGATISAAMSRAVSLPVTRIAATGVAGGNAARLTAQEQAQLTQIANKTDYEKYLARKQAEGKPARSYEDYIKARDKFAAIRQQGTDYEQAVAKDRGYTRENGWEGQKYAPNGKNPNEAGSRRWDFMHEGRQEAVEVKSGQVSEADFARQFDIDKTMVNDQRWQVTYHLNEPLSPSQMQRLTQFQAESGGRFSFTIGVP